VPVTASFPAPSALQWCLQWCLQNSLAGLAAPAPLENPALLDSEASAASDATALRTSSLVRTVFSVRCRTPEPLSREALLALLKTELRRCP
jgi:hypothetical protein